MESEVQDTDVCWPYSGWVPTANGRLSFRHIGDTAYPTRTDYANRIDGDEIRYILVSQRRELNDALLPSLTARFSHRSGTFDFILVARSDRATSHNEAVISGKIFIEPVIRQNWATRALQLFRRRNIEDPVIRLSAKVGEAISRLTSGRSYAAPPSPEDDHASIGRYLAAKASVHVDFQLARDGVVRVSRPHFGLASLGERSTAEAQAIGIDFPRYVAEQAYFFLRDVAHAHQHHEPQTDTLLGLQDTDASDEEWRNRLLFALHYHVIAQRRARDPAALVHAQGVIAYANSFEALSNRRLAPRELVKFEAEALDASISALIRFSEINNQRIARTRAHHRALAIWASVSLISVLAIFVQPRLAGGEAATYPHLYRMSAFFAGNLGYVLLVAIFVVVVPSVWRFSGRIESNGRSLLNDLRMPLHFYPRVVRVAQAGVGLVLILYALFVLFGPALVDAVQSLPASSPAERLDPVIAVPKQNAPS